jgi:hypothetical protein
MKNPIPALLHVLSCLAVSLVFISAPVHAIDSLRSGSAIAEASESDPGRKVVNYCKENMGKQIGNGECWTLADEAFKACAIRRPGAEIRVWGRVVDPKKERPQPGDIVEFRAVEFSDGSKTGPEHTAVIIKVQGRERFTVAQQNWGGHKTVRDQQMNIDRLKGGQVIIYRPGASQMVSPAP